MKISKKLISKISKKNCFVWLLLVFLAAVTMAGNDGNDLDASDSLNTSEFVDSVVDISDGGDIQSVSFKKDMGIRDALRFLSAKYQRNIVPSLKVEGAISVTNLYNVSFDEALGAILGNDFRYDTEDNFIKVYTADEYKKMKENVERMTYKMFTLYYTSAAEAQKMVTPLLSENGKTNVTSPADIGVPTDATISGQAGGGDTTAMNDKIIVYDYPENLSKIEDIIKSIDIRPRQVLVEATILSATLTEDTQFGIDWQTLKGSAITELTDITSASKNYYKSEGASVATATGGMTIGLALGDVGAFIRAVETVSDVTLMANPKILAINKQLGQIYIGTKVAYNSQTTRPDAGSATTSEVSFLDTGTKLSFRPYIGNDGYIRMDIHPKDSSATLNPTTELPDETSAELVTNIMVKDGQTIIIGGLFRDKVTSGKTQIPLLGDLPLVGGLFRGNSDKTERQEVIVLLTPHIIEEPEQAAANDRIEDIDRKRYGAKEGLQQIGLARIAEDYYASAVESYSAGDFEGAIEKLDRALKLRPTYLEALRLKEKIIMEKDPLEYVKTERAMVEELEQDGSTIWHRR